MGRVCFIIFAHSGVHDAHDVDDMIDNITYFHGNSDFMVLHPTMSHPKIKLNEPVGRLNHSSFIFGPLSKLIKTLTEEEVNSFDHFCLVSANQYFIGDIKFEEDVNYIQYYNTDNWDNTYHGKDTDKTIVGFPLEQPYGRWDQKNFYKELGLETPMVANWECMTLTNKTMLLGKQYIDKCLEYFPNNDMINLFLPYMALLSGQRWEFPPHFGTYDPANKPHFNRIITEEQVVNLKNDGYFSVKRLNYKRNCTVKQYIRKNLMK